VLPQIAGAIVTQGPLVFLGLLSSPLDAATYSILLRIGTPIQQLQQLFLVQVWPAITEALHRGDVVWLRKALPRVFKLNLFFGASSAIIISIAVELLFPALARNRSIQPTHAVVLLYAASVGIMCVVQGLAYIGNGLSRLAMQNWLALVSIVFAFTALPAVAAARGTAGTIGAFIALNCLFSVPLLYHEYRSFLRQRLARVGWPAPGPDPRRPATGCPPL
jgi:O-antigen/teichoic acid export membrane protein